MFRPASELLVLLVQSSSISSSAIKQQKSPRKSFFEQDENKSNNDENDNRYIPDNLSFRGNSVLDLRKNTDECPPSISGTAERTFACTNLNVNALIGNQHINKINSTNVYLTKRS